MKIKQIFLILIFVFAAVQANAQLGFRIGGNLSTLSYKDNSDDASENDPDYKAKMGLNVGLTYDFGNILIFQPGLYFSQKGYKIKAGDINLKFTFNYLEMPLNILYKLDLGICKVYGGIGPVFSYAIGGKYKWEYSQNDQDYYGTEKVKFKSRPDNYAGKDLYFDNALDLGAQISAGIEFNRFSLNLNYNIGLLRLNDEKTYSDGSKNDIVQRNRTFGFTIGYRFGEDK